MLIGPPLPPFNRLGIGKRKIYSKTEEKTDWFFVIVACVLGLIGAIVIFAFSCLP